MFIVLLTVLATLFSLIVVIMTKGLTVLEKDTKRFSVQLKLLSTLPVFAAIILAIVIYNFHSLYEERISHALLVLGYWVMATSSLSILKFIKNNKTLYIMFLLNTAISTGLAIFLTPLDRYALFFHKPEYILAFILSGCLLLLYAIHITKMRKYKTI